MIFSLSTVSSRYSEEEAEPLRELGFSFIRDPDPYCDKKGQTLQIQGDVEIHFGSLEELAAFAEKHQLIMCGNRLQIYDGYVE